MHGGTFTGTKFSHIAKQGSTKRPWNPYNPHGLPTRSVPQNTRFQDPQLMHDAVKSKSIKLGTPTKGFDTPKVPDHFTCLWCRSTELMTRYSLAVHTVERHKDKMTSPPSLRKSTALFTDHK